MIDERVERPIRHTLQLRSIFHLTQVPPEHDTEVPWMIRCESHIGLQQLLCPRLGSLRSCGTQRGAEQNEPIQCNRSEDSPPVPEVVVRRLVTDPSVRRQLSKRQGIWSVLCDVQYCGFKNVFTEGSGHARTLLD